METTSSDRTTEPEGTEALRRGRFDGTLITGRWWAVALRGVAAILFGVLTFIWPGLSLLTLVSFFGAYSLIDGVINLVEAARGRTRARRRVGWLVFQGLSGIAAGVITFFWPGVTAFALVLVIGAWAIATGAAAVINAVRLRKEIEGEWLLGASGVLSIVFGVLLLLFPGAGALALVLWIGAYAVTFGALLVFLGFRLRALQERPGGRTPQRRESDRHEPDRREPDRREPGGSTPIPV